MEYFWKKNFYFWFKPFSPPLAKSWLRAWLIIKRVSEIYLGQVLGVAKAAKYDGLNHILILNETNHDHGNAQTVSISFLLSINGD